MEFFAWCVLAAGIGMGIGSFGTGIAKVWLFKKLLRVSHGTPAQAARS